MFRVMPRPPRPAALPRIIRWEFRAPADVVAALDAEAMAAGVSRNAEMLTLLREALAARARRKRREP